MTYAAVVNAMARFKLTEPISLEDLAYIKKAIAPTFPGEPVEVYRHKSKEPVTVCVGSVVAEFVVGG